MGTGRRSALDGREVLGSGAGLTGPGVPRPGFHTLRPTVGAAGQATGGNFGELDDDLFVGCCVSECSWLNPVLPGDARPESNSMQLGELP